MKSSGKIIGIILVGAGVVLCLGISIWLIVTAIGKELTAGGAALGAIITLVLSAPLVGGGIFLFIQGSREEKAMAEVSRQRKVLNIVKTRGQITIDDLVLEVDATYDQVKEWVHDLVGKGLFSGYINWEEGTLYSQQASQLKDVSHCKHCGGEVNLAGRGVVRCPYCGTEYFL
jgi:hypothetical protein